MPLPRSLPALHPEYKNQRCVHAVKNIGRVYDTLLDTGDFLAEGPEKQGG